MADVTGVIGWVDGDDLAARQDWAARMDPADLAEVLQVAYELGCEFGPLLAGGIPWTPDYPGPVPARFVRAQAAHARDIARASYVENDGQIGPDGFVLTVWPMDRTIKNLYRPRRGNRRGPR